MKAIRCVWLCGAVALWLGCGDAYKPPNNTIIIDENNQMGPPAGSDDVAVGFPSGALLEGGSPVTVTVALKRPPSAVVRVDVFSSNEAAGTVSPASLTFDAVSWGTPQTLTITPVDDEVATGDKAWQLEFEVAGDDASFTGKPVNPLKLSTIDNDAAPSIVAAPVGLAQTTEQGGTVTLSVQLSKQPQGDVLIPIQLSDPNEATLDQQSVTFNTLNWNLAQQIVVTGKDDNARDGDKRFEVLFGPANSADEEFNGIGPASVSLTNIDGVCGNGVVDGVEACEPDGVNECEFGQMECMVCNNACELVPGNVTGFCGDGITQNNNGEQCDTPTMPCPYGRRECIACNAQCQNVPGELTGFCGDGVVQPGDEQCDGPTQPCPYGQMSCMTCRNCQNVPGSVTGFCGDGRVQMNDGEQCDPMAAAPPACPMGQIGDQTCLNTCKIKEPCSAPTLVGLGGTRSCAIFGNGTARCWGGDGGTITQLAGIATAEQIVGGTGHMCVLLDNGQMRCWGNNFDGQLGTGDYNSRTAPAIVTQITTATQIAAANNATCALLANGTVRCWGSGAVVPGTSLTYPTPQTVPGLSNVTQIAMAYNAACAVISNGQVKCWGSGYYGELGNGGNNSTATPVTVTSLSNAAEVAGGSYHFCARTTGNQVVCWGGNESGQLGDGGTTNRNRPSPAIAGLSGVAQLTAGAWHTCARLSSGGVRCWGRNESEQLGDGTSNNRYTPTPVFDLTDAAHIASGAEHVCVVRSVGQVACWGNNYSYQVDPTGSPFGGYSTPNTVTFE